MCHTASCEIRLRGLLPNSFGPFDSFAVPRSSLALTNLIRSRGSHLRSSVTQWVSLSMVINKNPNRYIQKQMPIATIHIDLVLAFRHSSATCYLFFYFSIWKLSQCVVLLDLNAQLFYQTQLQYTRQAPSEVEITAAHIIIQEHESLMWRLSSTLISHATMRFVWIEPDQLFFDL